MLGMIFMMRSKLYDVINDDKVKSSSKSYVNICIDSTL